MLCALLLWGVDMTAPGAGVIPSARSESSNLPFLGVLTGAADTVVLGVLPGSPADVAGVRQGDVILEIAGQTVPTGAELFRLLRRYRAGDAIAVALARDERRLDVTLSAGSR